MIAEVVNAQAFEAERRVAWALDHPDVSAWLKATLAAALECDPVRTANDVELLRDILRCRAFAHATTALQAGATSGGLTPNPPPGRAPMRLVVVSRGEV